MLRNKEEDLRKQIIEKAEAFGACLIGIADVETIRSSPSHVIYDRLDEYKGVGSQGSDERGQERILWYENAKSVIIVAIEHPKEKPETDWWRDGYTGGTHGNRILMDINTKLSEWLEKEKGIKTKRLSYYVRHGGIFLKDAAVMAGLGCLGRNNLLVTPQFGPRVRLRAMLTNTLLPVTKPVDFDPCKNCDMPCRKACPQGAFLNKIYSEEEFGLDKLPARSGVYDRNVCNIQMERDADNSSKIEIKGHDATGRLIKYCRKCEFACPVGTQ